MSSAGNFVESSGNLVYVYSLVHSLSPCAFLKSKSCRDFHRDNQPFVAGKSWWPSFFASSSALHFDTKKLTRAPLPVTMANDFLTVRLGQGASKVI